MGVLHLATREATICKRPNARNVTTHLSAVTCRNCDKQFDAAVYQARDEWAHARMQARFRKAAHQIGIGHLWDQLAADESDSAAIHMIRDMLGSIAFGLIEMGAVEVNEEVVA